MNSSRDEQGRQKLSDRETDEQAKQVKPVGLGQSVESSLAQDNGKSDAGTWEAVIGRENMLNALKRVESNKGAAGIDGMEVKELRSYLKAHWLGVRETLESGKYRPSREILLRIVNRTKERFMEKIRHLTKRTRSGKLENIVRNVNQYVVGWIGATTPSVYKELDEMDKAKAETDGLEALETGHGALPGVTETWST